MTPVTVQGDREVDDLWRQANAAHAYVAWLRRQPDCYWPQLVRNRRPGAVEPKEPTP